MKEYIYSRNAVYETLCADQRQAFQLLIADGVKENERIRDIISLARNQNIQPQRVPRNRLDSVHRQHQGVVLQVSGFPYRELADILALALERGEEPLVLLLDTLQDPQNLGTLLRTAEAVGVHGVVIPKAHTALVTPAVVNASSGASEHLAARDREEAGSHPGHDHRAAQATGDHEQDHALPKGSGRIGQLRDQGADRVSWLGALSDCSRSPRPLRPPATSAGHLAAGGLCPRRRRYPPALAIPGARPGPGADLCPGPAGTRPV